MLLEAYFMHLDNTYNRLQTLNEVRVRGGGCAWGACAPVGRARAPPPITQRAHNQTHNTHKHQQQYIEDTEDLVNLQLDQHRNQLIGIDLVLTAFSAAVAVMTAVAGYFGMNLNSEMQAGVGCCASPHYTHTHLPSPSRSPAPHPTTHALDTTHLPPPNPAPTHTPHTTKTAHRKRRACSPP